MNWKNLLTFGLGLASIIVSRYSPEVAAWLPAVGAGLMGTAIPRPSDLFPGSK